MEWNPYTYRLDELTRKFDLPIVIHLTEGYYSETDAEGFSAGDIMTIDSELTLHKVAAYFEDDKNRSVNDYDYADVADQEILIPLNYKGKLKVIKEEKVYDNINDLCKDFPRYAKLRNKFTVKTENSATIDIQAGTVIELDRLIPGSIRGTIPEPDKLVIDFKHNNKAVVVAVPTSAQGKFVTEPDENEYTIKDAIDRYKLPQVIQFLDEEIKRVYTQDLEEGIENMKTITITDTLRLNRLVTQNVLVGHYKPLEGVQNKDTESFRQRTLVVIPLDIPDVREIEVNVLEGVTEELYDEVFLVRNVSDDLELVDGSLYIDFATKPRITRIESKCVVSSGSRQQSFGNALKETASTDSIPPPLPPKPGQRVTAVSVGAPARKPPIPLGPRQAVDWGDDGYVKSDQLRDRTEYSHTLADINFATVTAVKQKKKDKQKKKSTKPKLVVKPSKNKHPSIEDDDQGDYAEIYEEIDENKLQKMKAKIRVNYESPPTPIPVMAVSHASHSEDNINQNKDHKTKLVMPVSPLISNEHACGTIKKFSDLSVSELVERLNICGMSNVATICKEEHLDGDYVSKLDREDLTKEPFNLSEFRLKKMERIKSNWVPALSKPDS